MTTPQDPTKVFIHQDDGSIHIRRRAVPGFRMDTHTMSPEEALRMEKIEQATEFAARITAAIDDADATGTGAGGLRMIRATDRLHVAAFLSAFQRAEEGLRYCVEWWGEPQPCNCDDGPDGHLHHPALFAFFTAARDEAWAGLVRIGIVYGETP